MTKYSYDKTSSECKDALKVCANGGNYLCTMALGELNLEEGQFKEAISNFKQCSGKYKVCDFRLGFLYHHGQGVLQNDDKAINFYKKAADLGSPHAAYNISVIYADKIPSKYSIYKYSSEGESQYSNYTILDYAWLKVAMALGMNRYTSKADEELPITKLFDLKKESLASEGLLQRGDNMAEQICSKNKFCKE